MTAFILREACESCDHIGHETETGQGYCKRSPSGDPECPPYLKAHHYESIAVEVARCLVKLEPDARLRREIAEAVGDGFADALYEYDEAHAGDGYGRGAQVSTEAFCEMCQCGRGAVGA